MLITRLKLADHASSVGALALGIGLGTYLSSSVGGAAVLVLLVGLVLHSVGMFFKHRFETKGGSASTTLLPAWANWLYWLCWILVTLLLLYLFATKNAH